MSKICLLSYIIQHELGYKSGACLLSSLTKTFIFLLTRLYQPTNDWIEYMEITNKNGLSFM